LKSSPPCAPAPQLPAHDSSRLSSTQARLSILSCSFLGPRTRMAPPAASSRWP
jgi:hypothetical protein